MATDDWAGLTVLYVTPLKALLNNLSERLSDYADWMGRRVDVWHGDVGESRRRAIRADPPDVLLTTPESIEAMLASTKTDTEFFTDLRPVVVDEVHAFAADDRGWHLSALLARLEHLVGRPLQRIGMSATVGNPVELLRWLQGGLDGRPGRVLAPGIELDGPQTPPATGDAEVVVDAVETLESAAVLLSKLYRGGKRLVFVDSRRQAKSWPRCSGRPAWTCTCPIPRCRPKSDDAASRPSPRPGTA